jgi:hypothetical protein
MIWGAWSDMTVVVVVVVVVPGRPGSKSAGRAAILFADCDMIVYQNCQDEQADGARICMRWPRFLDVKSQHPRGDCGFFRLGWAIRIDFLIASSESLISPHQIADFDLPTSTTLPTMLYNCLNRYRIVV